MKKLNILILDDNPKRHKVFANLFLGNHMTHCFTAQFAIDRLKKERFDLVCLDHDLSDF